MGLVETILTPQKGSQGRVTVSVTFTPPQAVDLQQVREALGRYRKTEVPLASFVREVVVGALPELAAAIRKAEAEAGSADTGGSDEEPPEVEEPPAELEAPEEPAGEEPPPAEAPTDGQAFEDDDWGDGYGL